MDAQTDLSLLCAHRPLCWFRFGIISESPYVAVGSDPQCSHKTVLLMPRRPSNLNNSIGQEPTVLAVGVCVGGGEGVITFFSLLYHISFLSPPLSLTGRWLDID